jgi:hypothetical protein
MTGREFFHIIKPGLPKRTLFYVAAVVWTIAGGMLLFKGISLFLNYNNLLWLKIMISSICGILFYLLLFSGISRKHTIRIRNLKNEKPCLFSFFNFRSYLLMASMIISGMMLRKSGIISPAYLSVLYVTMGIPLFLSSVRFYYAGIYYNENERIV